MGCDIVERHLIGLQFVFVVCVYADLRRVFAQDDAVRPYVFYEPDNVGQMVLLATKVVLEYVYYRAVLELGVGSDCIMMTYECS
jgi:hypothetical protein